jgi:peptide deformylase
MDNIEGEVKPTEAGRAKLLGKLSNISIGSSRQRWVIGIPVVMLFISLLLALVLTSWAKPEPPAVPNHLAPVLPGTAIKKCRPVDERNFEKLSHDWLNDLLASAASHEMSMVTAQHFGMPRCVIVVCPTSDSCYAMINPTITNTHSPVPVTHEDPLLCSNPGAVQSKRYKNIDVEWYDTFMKKRVEKHIEKPDSYKLQHMMDVLYGKDVCN